MDIDLTYLEEAGFLFERERGVHDDYIEFRLHQSQLSDLSISEVAAAISSYISNNIGTSNELFSAAISTLGQSHNDKYVTLYLDVMKKSQQSNVSACLQAVLALEKLEIHVFSNKDEIVDEDTIIKAINYYLNSYYV